MGSPPGRPIPRINKLKRIICVLTHHKWQFAYNHGISLGDTRSMDEILKLFDTGEVYAVYECTRCHTQERETTSDGRRIVKESEMEAP